jgi:hypothetical protein
MFVSHKKHLLTSTACYEDSCTFLYANYIRTAQETPLSAPTSCYGDSFTFLYIDVRTAQETHLWTSTACYEDSFTFLYGDGIRTA